MADVQAPEVEAKAREMGWVPLAEFKGDPSKHIDAATFVERGETFVPFLKKQNEGLRNELSEVKTQLTTLGGELKASGKLLETITAEREAELAAATKAAREEAEARLAKASREGDHEEVAAATTDIARLTAEERAAEAERARKAKEGEHATTEQSKGFHPEVTSWFDQHKAFASDQRRIAVANVVAAEMRQKGDKRVGAAFMDDVAAEVEKYLGGQGPAFSKVEGGGPTGGGGTGGKGYADLPAEAKAVCDRQASRMVGPGRLHKDVASFRAAYAATYFKE